MKSKKQSTNKISLNSSIEELFNRKADVIISKLKEKGIKTIRDLVWIFPNKIESIPEVKTFSHITEDKVFSGIGKVVFIKARPLFFRKRSKYLLYNIDIGVRDYYSEDIFKITWFNCYSSVKRKLEKVDFIFFSGLVKNYQNSLQISNPHYQELQENEIESFVENNKKKFLRQYPSINNIKGDMILNLIDRIPEKTWQDIPNEIPTQLSQKNNFIAQSSALLIMHGKDKNNDKKLFERARNQLIYQEFFDEQLKIFTRKNYRKKFKAPIIKVEEKLFEEFLKVFPYQLTVDQKKCLNELRADISSSVPMSRLIQGDVGCGKTTIAIISTLITLKNGYQVAFMCPTESLAIQHYINHQDVFDKFHQFKTALLLGSTSAKEKRKIKEGLEKNEIHYVIGTHSLIQNSVNFSRLGLSIIDEQHKFGVQQRIALAKKHKNSHCLIMTATPIPRSLNMIQYGDLEISIIRSYPQGKKSIKTKIITPKNFSNFLNFLQTRINLGEQVYIIVAAIQEGKREEILNLEYVLKKFKTYFPQYRISCLHGQMKSEEKREVFLNFKNGNADILISTSVVEVGIDIPNATTVAIFNPERFGLSSLHQLRGRVGRAGRAGFCFLVLDQDVHQDKYLRLKIIEDNNDGFNIAEEDLRLRGSGDIFGEEQSGYLSSKRKISNIVSDREYLIQARQDLEKLLQEKDSFIINKISQLKEDKIISTTI